MGLFDLIGIGGSPEKKIERQLKKVKQGYAQPEYRRAAMEALLDMKTPEAYAALCKRFIVVCNSVYWDEEEKRWLVEVFVDLGEEGVGPLKDFVLKEDNVNYPVRALEQLLKPEEMTAFLVEALTSRDPDDYRRDRGKLELIDHLGTRQANPALIKSISPYLHDHSDDVICKTVEVFEDWKCKDTAEQLLGLVYDDTMSARVQRRAAEAVERLGIEASSELEPLPDAVAEDFEIDGRKLKSVRPKTE